MIAKTFALNSDTRVCVNVPSVSSPPFVSFFTLFFLCFGAGTSPAQFESHQELQYKYDRYI